MTGAGDPQQAPRALLPIALSLAAVVLGGVLALVVLLGAAQDTTQAIEAARAACAGEPPSRRALCEAQRIGEPTLDASAMVLPGILMLGGVVGLAVTAISLRRARGDATPSANA